MLKDSGTRVEYPGGGRKETGEGKGRFDLLSPLVLRRVAKHFQLGADKYGDRNWESGIPLHRYVDSMMRHLGQFLAGETDEDHLSAIGCNYFMLAHTKEMIDRGLLPKELDDLPYYFKGGE